jgi:hypothetical protein
MSRDTESDNQLWLKHKPGFTERPEKENGCRAAKYHIRRRATF